MKLLVVDDDLELAGLVAYALRQAGYFVVVAHDGEAALRVLADEQPDLVVLDVNLPGIDGFETLRRIRLGSRVPVLLLTVRAGEEDVVRGLDLGADDHVAKPFSPRTLLARVRALLRRAGIERPATLAAGDLAIDPQLGTLSIRGGEPVRLTGLEARLLQLLLANHGTPLPAERLIAHVWGARGEGDRQLLKQLVHRLRQKLERDVAAPRYLQTVPGTGYVLMATATS